MATTATKFKVSGVKVKCVKTDDEDKATTSILSQLKPYSNNHCTDVLMETKFSSSVRASRNNGFVNTVIRCYNNHNNLVIRPDDIWTAILMQFSFYINKNAEEFRGQFVDFEGKRELVVTIDGELRSAPYDFFVTKMTEKIDENLVDKTLKDWVLPNFSTTTSNDTISCGVILMATTKKYFDFTCCLMCGIPYVTLEGTVDDWENILNRLEKLKSYKLDKWYDLLQPILKEFVAAKENQVNLDFWNRICHYSGGGSGPTFISGWLAAFAVFDEDGNWTDSGSDSENFHFNDDMVKENERWRWIPLFLLNYFKKPKKSIPERVSWPEIDIDKIPSGFATVDVKICDRDGDHESIMFAGHIGYDVLKGHTLKPQIGWGIALKLESEDVENMHEAAREGKQWRCKDCIVSLSKSFE